MIVSNLRKGGGGLGVPTEVTGGSTDMDAGKSVADAMYVLVPVGTNGASLLIPSLKCVLKCGSGSGAVNTYANGEENVTVGSCIYNDATKKLYSSSSSTRTYCMFK